MALTFLTGASSGIGRSLARRLAADEPIALVARRAPLLDTLAEEIRSSGGHETLTLACDVTDRAAVHDAVAAAEAKLGPVTRLVANAGGGDRTHLDDFSADHIRASLELNVMGVVHCIEAVLPGMLERRAGHIVVMSSIAAYRGLPSAAAYSASKGAVTNLAESLRMDLHPHGIDVTVLAPGFVNTKLSKKAGKKSKPFRMQLEPATERMARSIRARKPFDAFPLPLVALATWGRLMPAGLYDRIMGGRGSKAKRGTPGGKP
ncbi:MAG: SDR family NAD(P)-dependent oxidoreductase [Myxococcota bacterium]|nr:SDR family NAD(P)-dependent oxidoreductase [Myxococcota bacterium]